jgi:hypothetical protein
MNHDQIIQEFRERFIYEDTGPDGDGYDAELPCWNDAYKHQNCSEWDLINSLEQFWLAKLDEQKKEFAGVVEGLKIIKPNFNMREGWHINWNRALDAVLGKLKQ